MPYALGDAGDGQKAFTSWSEREGVEPVAAGPHWADVKRKLQDAGVDVFWDLQHAPEAREAPAVDIDIDIAQADPLAPEEKDGGDSSGSDDRGDHDKDGDDSDGDEDSEEVGLKVGGGGGGEVSGGRKPSAGGVAPPAAGVGGEEPVAVAAAAEGEVTGLSWKKFFVIMVSCVGVGYVACTSTRRRRDRRRSAKRRKQLMDWSASAFSTHTLSPLGGTAKTTASFGWKGALRSKHHQV